MVYLWHGFFIQEENIILINLFYYLKLLLVSALLWIFCCWFVFSLYLQDEHNANEDRDEQKCNVMWPATTISKKKKNPVNVQ